MIDGDGTFLRLKEEEVDCSKIMKTADKRRQAKKKNTVIKIKRRISKDIFIWDNEHLSRQKRIPCIFVSLMTHTDSNEAVSLDICVLSR